MGFQWLGGVWRGAAWGGVMEESWGEWSAGHMMGTNRVIRDGQVVHREFLEIADGCMTVRIPRRDLETVQFSLIECQASSAVFANPDHNRLSRIEYSRLGETLTIALSGIRSGEPFLDEIKLTRSIFPNQR